MACHVDLNQTSRQPLHLLPARKHGRDVLPFFACLFVQRFRMISSVGIRADGRF